MSFLSSCCAPRSQLCQQHHAQPLHDLIAHCRLYLVFQVTLGILLSYVASLELLCAQRRLFLDALVVCFGEGEHFLRERGEKVQEEKISRRFSSFGVLRPLTLIAFSLLSLCTPQSLNLNPSVQLRLCRLPSMLCSSSVFL